MVRRFYSALRFLMHRASEFRTEVGSFYRHTGDFQRTKRFAGQLLRSRCRHVRELIHSKAEAEDAWDGIAVDIARDERPLLAILVTGGIGDYIVAARFLRDLAAETGEFRFDVFCSNATVAMWTFVPLRGFNKVYGQAAFGRLQARYPLALRVHHLVEVWLKDADWGLLARNERLAMACLKLAQLQCEFADLVRRHPFLDNELANRAVKLGFRRETLLQGAAGVKYGGAAYPLPLASDAVARFRLPTRYVTVNNAVDTNFIVTGSAPTKSYPHWDRLVEVFTQRYPDIAVVQVGSSGSTPIKGVDVSVVGKTTLREAAAIIGSSLLHIDHEGGLVHVAASLGTTSAVIFGPTSLDYFAYPQNINLPPPVCGNCWWVERSWMDLCPSGHEDPPCMHLQRPIDVVNAITRMWNDKTVEATTLRRHGGVRGHRSRFEAPRGGMAG